MEPYDSVIVYVTLTLTSDRDRVDLSQGMGFVSFPVHDVPPSFVLFFIMCSEGCQEIYFTGSKFFFNTVYEFYSPFVFRVSSLLYYPLLCVYWFSNINRSFVQFCFSYLYDFFVIFFYLRLRFV